jgi:hypothetical protein
MTTPSVVVHAHCYQPPRADPFTGTVPVEPSASPFHDWNARIVDECYAPLGRARVLETHARVNLYEWISFNASPTLAEWLAQEAPGVHDAMLAGDAASVRRLGHGNAIATPYHHVILPLATERERQREIAWGLQDFRERFKREAEGFWAPETALDDASLASMADAGIQFVFVAPYQIEGGGQDGVPRRWTGPGDRTLLLVPYNGDLSGAIGFGQLGQQGDRLGRLLTESAQPQGLATIATDGETFGHHKRHGELALARALDVVRNSGRAQVTNAAAYIASRSDWPAGRLVNPSAWSCAHGIERWRSNCGCRADHGQPPRQQWRAPLRYALRWLADAIDAAPTAASVARGPDLAPALASRYAMFTSCGWFFDHLEGHETRICLRFAAHAIAGRPDAEELSHGVRDRLSQAGCNDHQLGSGADLWMRDYHPLALHRPS